MELQLGRRRRARGSGVVAETSNDQWGLRAVGTLRSILNLNCAWSGWI
jgi:hypothetical protein